jgi:DNA-binding IclR family transcriptional regulator
VRAQSVPTHVPGASSARKLLNALLCFTPDKPVWTVPELADRLDASISTMYRYVALLREVGLLDPTGENAYRVTDRALVLAQAAEMAGSRLERVALPVMTAIRDAVDETVLISRRTRTHAYCVDRVESRQPVRLQFDRGQPMSLHRGSMARILLAGMPLTERAAYLATQVHEEEDLRSVGLSDEALRQVAVDGWTQSFEEIDEGIWGAAAAITLNGQVHAALGVAAPLYRLDAVKRNQVIAEVRLGARLISAALEPDAQ